MDESLLARLKALGLERGTDKLINQTTPKISHPIEEVMNGEDIVTAFGRTFSVNANFSHKHQHGKVNFIPEVESKFLDKWSGRFDDAESEIEKIIFLDTETSGLAGGTGTFAFMVGLGYWTVEGFRLIQLFLREPAEEPAMLAYLGEILSSFNTVVTYNGKAFDIPLLNSRHILNAFTSPFTDFHHIDLLALARRIWKNRLPSRSLGTIETEILNVARGQEEIPGWMVPEMYFEYLKSGDARPLSGVFYHNEMDILSLAALFKFGAGLLNEPMNFVGEEGLDLIAVAKLYEELGILPQAIELYEHSLTLGLPRHFFVQTLYRYGHLAKKQGDWKRALYLWEKAALQDEVDACIEIAKYHEHIERNYENALVWTKKAVENLERLIVPRYSYIEYSLQLEHRKSRIIKKQNRGTQS